MNIINKRDKLFYLIGETIVAFQRIEYHNTELLYYLLDLNHEKKHLVLMDALSFNQKLNLILELAKNIDKDFKYLNNKLDLKLAKKCLNNAEQYRNKIVHSHYYYEKMEFKKRKVSIKGRNGLVINENNIDYNKQEKCVKALRKLDTWSIYENDYMHELNQIFNDFNNS